MTAIQLTPIGIIHTPFKSLEGMPIQPPGAKGISGWIELKEEFAAGIKDLDGFSYIYLIYYFHCSTGYSLVVKPYLDDSTHGLFATRAPKRPNPIGLSIVQLDKIENNIIHITNVDMLDETPLLDIKPYVPDFDSWDAAKIGWLHKRSNNATEMKSDARFKP